MKKLYWVVPAVAIVMCTLASATRSLASGGGVCLRANLTGARIGALVPKGRAEFCVDASRATLKVQAEDVVLANGTVLPVSVNGTTVGSIVLSFQKGELQLNSQDGSFIPAIQKGDRVTVFGPNNLPVVSGAF